MSNQILSPAAQKVEELLDTAKDNSLKQFLQRETSRQVEAQGGSPSAYEIFVIRRNDEGDEIFGPHRVRVGQYSEKELYGMAGSPPSRFRSAIQSMADQARKASRLEPDDVEYAHSVALFWASLSQLCEFIGQSPSITEIIAELRTASFQFLGKDTPPKFVTALAEGLEKLSEVRRFDSGAVDGFVDNLSAAGFDSFAQEAGRIRSE